MAHSEPIPPKQMFDAYRCQKRVYDIIIDKLKSTLKLEYDGSNLDEFQYKIESFGFLPLWDEFQNEVANGCGYESLQKWQERFKPLGLSFDYGLDADPYEFELLY